MISIPRMPSFLLQSEDASRTAPRRSAVEIATCPRQCADAFGSNFCRHMHRMVNTQAVVLTSARTSLADGSLGARSRPLSTTMRHHAGAIGSLSSPQGVYGCSTLGDKLSNGSLLLCS